MAQRAGPGRSFDGDSNGNKRGRVDTDEFSGESLDSKRVRLDSAVPEPHESKSERENFLEMLEEEVDVDPEIQGLESVIRSLEREINPPAPAELIESEPDPVELGFLLGASDDELGLPPAESVGVGAPIESRTADLADVNGFVGNGVAGDENHRAGDLLTGLFEYGGYADASDFAEMQRWTESMPAV